MAKEKKTAAKKLKRYRVHGVVTGGKYLGEFEAASAKQAVETALESEAASVSLCHHCSRDCEDPEIHTAVAKEITE